MAFKKINRDKINKKEIIIEVNTCTFTGHRPNKLYGYDLNNPKYKQLAKTLANHLRWLIENEGVRRFISGGAIGYDTVAFFVVEQMKREYQDIENILAIPFANQDIKWNPIDRERYSRMKQQADKIVYVDEIKEYKSKEDTESGTFSSAKMQKRNEYMVDHSNYMIALWNRDYKSGTANCMRYLRKQGHFKRVAVINPTDLGISYEAC